MSKLAVFTTCQKPDRSGLPSGVRGMAGAPAVCASTSTVMSEVAMSTVMMKTRSFMAELCATREYPFDATNPRADRGHRCLAGARGVYSNRRTAGEPPVEHRAAHG